MAIDIINKFYTEVNKIGLVNGDSLLTFSNNHVVYISNLAEWFRNIFLVEVIDKTENDFLADLFNCTPLHTLGGIYEQHQFLNKLKSLWADNIILFSGNERIVDDHEIVAFMYALSYIKNGSGDKVFEIITDSSSYTKLKVIGDPNQSGLVFDFNN